MGDTAVRICCGGTICCATCETHWLVTCQLPRHLYGSSFGSRNSRISVTSYNIHVETCCSAVNGFPRFAPELLCCTCSVSESQNSVGGKGPTRSRLLERSSVVVKALISKSFCLEISCRTPSICRVGRQRSLRVRFKARCAAPLGVRRFWVIRHGASALDNPRVTHG